MWISPVLPAAAFFYKNLFMFKVLFSTLLEFSTGVDPQKKTHPSRFLGYRMILVRGKKET